MDVELRERFVEVARGVRLHLVEAGPEEGPAVLLLHGFPELWLGWRHQIPFLAERGYRVLAPDQRGYNLSDKPRGLAAYRLDVLARDAEALIAAAGYHRAYVAGHDWGAAVAWWLALRRPRAVRALAVLNVPHPLVMRRYLFRDPAQRRRSRYMLLFQLPFLPERSLARDGWRRAVRAVQGTAREGTFSDADMDRYREAWSRPGAARGMLAWYRAMLRRPVLLRARHGRIAPPTLVLWGGRDRFVGKEMVEPSLALCDRGEAEVFPDATHWLQHEEPEAVNRRLHAFFSAHR